MTLAFQLEPFIGALPLRFGMDPLDVRLALGEGTGMQVVTNGDRVVHYDTENILLKYSAQGDQLAQITFMPGSVLLYDGVNLVPMYAELASYLSRIDPKVARGSYWMAFGTLGLIVTGYCDLDRWELRDAMSDMSISVVSATVFQDVTGTATV